MTNTIPNVPRELLADLLGNDHDKRIMAERHLLAMLANAPSPAGVYGLEVVGYLFQHEETGNVMSVDAQQVDWGFEANNPRLHRVCALADYDKAQAIIDGLRGEVGVVKAASDNYKRIAVAALDDHDQQAQRIGELEGLLRSCLPALSDGGCAALANRIDAALSAVCAAAPNIAPTSEHSGS